MASETASYRIHHTMIRVKDPQVSREFYETKLGMKYDLVVELICLYFFAYVDEVPPEESRSQDFLFSLKGPVIELTHNWGTESDPTFGGYHHGNSEPRGFGHIAIVVPDVYSACERLERMGVNIRRKPGPMHGTVNIAFVEDPDGYWIELISLPAAAAKAE